MYEELIMRLMEDKSWIEQGTTETEHEIADHLQKAADAIESTNKAYQMISEAYEAEVTKQNWIPVTERLPDPTKDESAYSGRSAEIAPSDDVLCYLGSEKRQTVAWYSHTYKEWTTVDENTVYRYGEVTHWMPLPSAPMEE